MSDEVIAWALRFLIENPSSLNKEIFDLLILICDNLSDFDKKGQFYTALLFALFETEGTPHTEEYKHIKSYFNRLYPLESCQIEMQILSQPPCHSAPAV